MKTFRKRSTQLKHKVPRKFRGKIVRWTSDFIRLDIDAGSSDDEAPTELSSRNGRQRSPVEVPTHTGAKQDSNARQRMKPVARNVVLGPRSSTGSGPVCPVPLPLSALSSARPVRSEHSIGLDAQAANSAMETPAVDIPRSTCSAFAPVAAGTSSERASSEFPQASPDSRAEAASALRTQPEVVVQRVLHPVLGIWFLTRRRSS